MLTTLLPAGLVRLLLGLQQALLRADWEAPPRRSLIQQVTDLFSGAGSSPSIFNPQYLIYWVELLVMASIIFLVLYVSYALKLFRKDA